MILGSFGESFLGFSEEVKTRGFPSPSFGGFGFVVIYCDLNLSRAHCHDNLTPPLLVAAVCRIPVECNVRFGSLAASFDLIRRMAASEGKADAFRFNFGSLGLNVRFSQERTLSCTQNHQNYGPLSARSGHPNDQKNDAVTGRKRPQAAIAPERPVTFFVTGITAHL